VKKSIAFFFLLVFSISLPGFSIELHFCQGKVTDVAIFGDAVCTCDKHAANHVEEVVSEDHDSTNKSCCEKEKVTENCDLHVGCADQHEADSFTKKCCKTEKLTITSAKLKALSALKNTKAVLLAVAVLNPYSITEGFSQPSKDSYSYEAPPLKRNLVVLHRVFRI
jgi:hypothetical protein